MSKETCSDCGGFDIEWMYRCAKHGVEYCRGCSCPICAEEEWDNLDEDGPMDLEDQLDVALDAAYLRRRVMSGYWPPMDQAILSTLSRVSEMEARADRYHTNCPSCTCPFPVDIP